MPRISPGDVTLTAEDLHRADPRIADLTEINKTMWSYGDYAKVAELLWPGAVRLVDQLGDQSGAAHLDIATGNGNVAVLTAGLGASVTGLDLTAEFFPDARRRATAQGSTVRFMEGDVERLPFPDRSFDTVTSAYGIQFAPRHRRAAAEVARVCKPEGVLGMCNWTPRSWTAHFHEVISDYFPAPPEFAGQPMRWGDERYLQRLLGDERGVRDVGPPRNRGSGQGAGPGTSSPSAGRDPPTSSWPTSRSSAARRSICRWTNGGRSGVRPSCWPVAAPSPSPRSGGDRAPPMPCPAPRGGRACRSSPAMEIPSTCLPPHWTPKRPRRRIGFATSFSRQDPLAYPKAH
ncbi:methyltransferase domain-containing protein [Actinomadura rubrisoli]|uniref:Methyltransferase domain-containing protein n=1 Tax=Actinomadura rubrisoli TaxID=2530368 RepID=A0A4R5CHM8_9ACTN|nr:methyltransferase domain-containing protein [Actinomadura rubrisoli]